MKKEILILKSTYYEEISKRLESGSKEYFEKFGISYDIVAVPGAMEIPVVLEKFKSKYRGFVIIGCIIRGETSHYDVVKDTVVSCIYETVLKEQLPLGLSLLTVDNYDQALQRSSVEAKINSGFRAAEVCVEMIKILKNEKF